MKKSLKKVLNLGQMDTTPANVNGEHFVAKVLDFGERKEVIVCCPKDSHKSYKIPLHSGLYGQLKAVKSEELFLLIERKGAPLRELFKLKDYSTTGWKAGDNYESHFAESLVVDLLETKVDVFASA
jgi:hypothetical protein